MNVQRDFLLLAALAAVVATPAMGQTAAPAATPASVTNSSASSTDFQGVWHHPALPWFEPLASGPRPVTNRSRTPGGFSNYDRLVGDYTNPVLQPWAANIVKRYGDFSQAGITFPNPANQCWPEPVPFIFKHNTMQMLQQPDIVTIMYSEDHDIRRIRMNTAHPAQLTPSWHGDSVGHYEGDTLVIDTVGNKTDRPFAMIDLFGTPFSEALHVVERYRLISPEQAKEALDRNAKENMRFGDTSHSVGGKYLQLTLTVEDPAVFTTPWTVTITYARGDDEWPEEVCAENTHEYYYRQESDVPTASRPDF